MASDLILGLVVLLIAGLVAVLVTRRLARWLAEASVQTKVRLAPVRRTMLTKDCRPTFATVRPTSGDELPREVLEQLERYVASREAEQLRRWFRRVRLEYQDGEWRERARRASQRTPPADPPVALEEP
ncbi:MAG TPA: hypothetical protein VKG38_00350 [Solirubrobacteraceae bacterium]|nr:hypothetical protein [Solirubrobacteraceae bacterium]